MGKIKSKTTEASVQAIFNAIPEKGDKLAFRINDDRFDEEATNKTDKLIVEISLPLGQTACHLEGTLENGQQHFTADFTYSESTLADGRIIIYD